MVKFKNVPKYGGLWEKEVYILNFGFVASKMHIDTLNHLISYVA